jgi:hypothetical protein
VNRGPILLVTRYAERTAQLGERGVKRFAASISRLCAHELRGKLVQNSVINLAVCREQQLLRTQASITHHLVHPLPDELRREPLSRHVEIRCCGKLEPREWSGREVYLVRIQSFHQGNSTVGFDRLWRDLSYRQLVELF